MYKAHVYIAVALKTLHINIVGRINELHINLSLEIKFKIFVLTCIII